MDPNRIQTPEHQTGDIPLNLGEFASAYHTTGIQEGVDPSVPVNPLFPASAENCDFALGGYSGTWGNFMSNFNFPIDPADTSEQLTPEQLTQLDEYLNSLSRADSSLSSAAGTAAYAGQHSTDLSGNAFLNGNTDFDRAADAGRQLYTEAYNQWNVGTGPVENGQFCDGIYTPFGVQNNAAQNEVFQPTVNQDIKPVNSTGGNSVSSHLESTTVSTKPSFAEVAKNKPTPVNPDPVPKINPRNCRSKPAKAGGTKKECPILKSTGTHHSGANSVKTNTKKSKSLRPANMQRSKSVPVEPSEIKPDSRYGLDTFDYSSTYPGEQRVAASCDTSRKNSSSSMSSGVSGLEDIHWGSSRNMEGSKGCDSHGSMNKQPAPPNTLHHGKESATPPHKQQEGEVHSQHGEKMFFDPRRIFQDSHEKSSKSDRKNNEDYVLNNKQKLQPEKEYILHKEKPKASVKCDSKFINNDLRESKKHTNIEQERDHHHGQKDSKAKSTNSTGTQGRSRPKVSKFEQTATSKNGNKAPRREMMDKQNIIGNCFTQSLLFLNYFCNNFLVCKM